MPVLRRLVPLTALCATLLAAGGAHALDPARSSAHSTHTAWTVDDGAPPGILSLAQGMDGYLWIGARDGLFRFDGLRFENVPPERPSKLGTSISALVASADGTLWIGYSHGSVSTYRRGILRDSALKPGNYVFAMAQTSDGAVWATLGNLDRGLARHYRGKWQDIGADWGLPREHLISLIATRDGSLWVATLQSVLRLPKGAARFQRMREIPSGHASLCEDAQGRIWMSDLKGSRPITGAIPAGAGPYPTPGFPRSTRSFFDRDGNLWGQTGRAGIFRVRSPAVSGAASPVTQIEQVQAKDGLLSDNSSALIEDREGNIWVGSLLGLERFRGANVVTEPAINRMATWGFSLLGASDGSVYVGQLDSVYRIAPGGRPEPVLEKVRETEAICEGADGTVWIVLQDRIVRIRGRQQARIARPHIKGLGVHDCAVDRQGMLWLGALDEGVYGLGPHGWQHRPLPTAREGPQIMVADRDRSLLLFDGGDTFFRFEDGSPMTVAYRAAAIERLYTVDVGPRELLLGGAFGLARARGRRIQILSADHVPAIADITGIVRTHDMTWLIGKIGIVRLPTDAIEGAFNGARVKLQPMVLDWRDGLPGTFIRDGQHGAVRGGDGRLWFATTGGVVWVDPTRLSYNPIPPPVAIAALRVRGTNYFDPSDVTLPAGTSSGEIDYAALSLSIPERVQVRYQLEGMDEDWIDPGQRRQMFFSNLRPGTYRFRVIAANNDGVWNRDGATLTFTIPPTFLQSGWFKLLCMLAVTALLWFAYSLRVHRVTTQLHAGMEVRIAERERIARELHDTLLQGFQGLVLHFQAAANRIPFGHPARDAIDKALSRADGVLAEGRDRVLDLRSETAGRDLAKAWLAAAAEFGSGGIDFDLTVEGQPRPLHPLVGEELQRIGEEAIRNAFQHSGASTIAVMLSYRRQELRLLVRDDGAGFPAEIASAGKRPGHYGLVGMRERARRIDGILTIVSRAGAGTEVLLSIPGPAAYSEESGRWWIPSFLKPKGER